MLISALILTGLTSFFISSIFKRGFYFFLIFFASIILNIEILSLLKCISGLNILILTLIESIIAFILYFFQKRPRFNIETKKIYEDFKKALLEDKILLILFFCWLFFMGASFTAAVLFPPTEADAQSYHVLRSLYWLKDGFISRFEITDERALCMPFNSEIFYTWIFALAKKDFGLGFLQFFSYFLLMVSGFKIMEILQTEFKKRLWAIFMFSSFAITAIQISGTQTDLTAGAFLSASIYLILSHKNNKSLSGLFFASLAASVAAGVKTTALIALIPLLIWFFAVLKKDFLKFILFFILNFLIFSSYSYILNFIDTGNIAAGSAFILYNKSEGGYKGFISNIIKYIFQFFDFSGFKIAQCLNDFIMNARNFVLSMFLIPENFAEIDSFNQINTRFNEQSGGFGVLGFLVFIPCVVMGFFKKNLRIFSIVFILSFLILCLLMSYTIYGIRYILCFVSISFPVLCLSYAGKNKVLKTVLAFFMAFYMIQTPVLSPERPLYEFIKTLKKGNGINSVREMARNKEDVFSSASSEEVFAIRKSVEPYCSNNNKIGLFLLNPSALYPAKYLELKNDCNIETLNLPHIENYNLEEYKAIIIPDNYIQNTNVFNKKDMEDPFVKSEKALCVYEVSKKGKNKIQMKNVIQGYCMLRPEYLDKNGFKKQDSLSFLRNDKNETKKLNLEVWSK